MSHRESLILQELQIQHCTGAAPNASSIRSNISDTWFSRHRRTILYFGTLCYYCFIICCQSCCQLTSTLRSLTNLRVLYKTLKRIGLLHKCVLIGTRCGILSRRSSAFQFLLNIQSFKHSDPYPSNTLAVLLLVLVGILQNTTEISTIKLNNWCQIHKIGVATKWCLEIMPWVRSVLPLWVIHYCRL